MAELHSPTTGEKPTLVILGQKGAGKSSLANRLFKFTAPIEANDSPSHVTLKQKLKATPEDKHFAGAVDMRGLDSNTNNFPNMHDLYGKPLVFLFLTCDPRVQDSVIR